MNDFIGCKLAILRGDHIVTLLRDDIPSIPWPNHWDMPGGIREPGESPETCILRELREELGLVWEESELHWRHYSPHPGSGHLWFFVSEQPNFEPSEVTFGDEGQEWRLVPLSWYLHDADSIEHQRDILKIYLNQRINIL